MTPTLGSRRSSRSAPRHLSLVVVLALALVVSGCASSRNAQVAKAVPNDPELGKGLDDLARAYETLDVNRIMPAYAAGDYALSWDNNMTLATGGAEHRNVLSGALAGARDVKLSLDPTFEAWRDGDRAWTTRKFTATGTGKNGEKISFAGWHSAIWERKDGKWLIAYEHVGHAAERAPAPPPPPPPAPASVATPAPAPPPVVALPFGDVFFDFDKSAIRHDQVAALDADVELLKKSPDVRVLIEGHCDERGGETYNFGLGERRAAAVKKYLVGKGVDPERLATVSFGKRKPFETGTGEPVWSKNRRAHFVQLEK